MSREISPVQPLDSAGSDTRLANMLAAAPIKTATPAADEGRPAERVAAHLCPNCKNGLGREVELDDTGICMECGYNAAGRLI